MNEKGINSESSRKELLNIFTEKDMNSNNVLEMSDFFQTYIDNLDLTVNTKTEWEICSVLEQMTGAITTAIKTGIDISSMGVLIADNSHFGKDIMDKLKKGIYHIGRSKEVSGNFRPAILDEHENLVKFFTLKRAFNPANVLADMALLSIQMELQHISTQIDSIKTDIKHLVDMGRKEKLHKDFLCAREKIIAVASAQTSEDEEKFYLHEAGNYLMEGLNSLYLDFEDRIKDLGKYGSNADLNEIDSILGYIKEDLQLIHRYVGLQAYIEDYQGNEDGIKRTMSRYRHMLQENDRTKIGGSNHTAFELIHMYCSYDENNMDFWLEKPKQMIEAIDSWNAITEQKDEDIFYISAEEDG